MSQIIEFHKVRGIAEIINVTFEFTKENIKGILKSVIFIAGPFILAGSALLGYIMYAAGQFSRSVLQGANPNGVGTFYGSIVAEILTVVVLMVLAFFFFYAATYEYINIYVKEKQTGIEVSDVWRAIRKDFWLMVKTLIGLIVMLFITIILFALGAGLLMALGSALGAVTSPFVTVLFIIPVYAFLFYLLSPYSLIFNVRINEKRRFFDSVSQCHKLISDNRMRTMGVLLLSIIIQFMLSFVLNLPRYIVEYLNLSSAYTLDLKWFTMASAGIAIIGSFAIGVISIVSINFQYFSLLEKKHATSLLNKIEGIGSTPKITPSGNEETY